MTDLELSCVQALRLSEAAAEALLPQIDLYIDIARAELIRSGVSKEVVDDESNALVKSAVICYVQASMADTDEGRKLMNNFRYQQDNLRKTKHEE